MQDEGSRKLQKAYILVGEQQEIAITNIRRQNGEHSNYVFARYCVGTVLCITGMMLRSRPHFIKIKIIVVELG